jgi:NAD-dependent SIR2 family protein deacetylase
MDFLKKEFLESVSVGVDDKRNIVIGGYTFTINEILESIIKPDEVENAYKKEFDRWLVEDWLPPRLDYLDDILKNHINKARFDHLCSAIEKEIVMPFIGAGMSVPSGIPTWSDSMKRLQRLSRLEEAKLLSFLQRGAFEDAASALLEKMPLRLFNEQLEQIYRRDHEAAISGPIRFLPEIFSSTILTTNYDTILEDLYKNRNNAFDSILYGTGIEDYRPLRADGSQCLLKIHGDFRLPRTRVLTKEEYDRFYLNTSKTCNEMSIILKNNSLLFLGCSLLNDRTMQLMYNLSKTDENFPRHFAFMKDPKDGEKMRDREHFLAERNISTIWYPDDHNMCLESLLVGIMDRAGVL